VRRGRRRRGVVRLRRAHRGRSRGCCDLGEFWVDWRDRSGGGC
jgi:hypothetical protein